MQGDLLLKIFFYTYLWDEDSKRWLTRPEGYVVAELTSIKCCLKWNYISALFETLSNEKNIYLQLVGTTVCTCVLSVWQVYKYSWNIVLIICYKYWVYLQPFSQLSQLYLILILTNQSVYWCHRWTVDPLLTDHVTTTAQVNRLSLGSK